jgi:hypothetical protein
MNTVEGVQILASTISLLALGFGAGTAYGRRHRSSRSLHANLEEVKRALTNIVVGELRVIPTATPLGAQVAIEYDVNSRLSTSLEVWLGADIQYAPDQYFYDVAQDKVIFIEPGRHTYTRYLTLAPPLPPGRWNINAGIWFGTKSDPDRSIRLVLKPVELSVTN